MKPKIRHEAKASLVNIVAMAFEREHNYLYQSCINCEYFDKEKCILVNQTPPAKVIVFGCEKWLEKDEIPF